MTQTRTFAAIAALAAMATAAGVARGQVPVVSTVAPQNIVGLSASATAEIAKDELTIVFSTTREGPDAAQVQGQLRQALDAALAEARRAVRPGQLEVRTGNFSLLPRYASRGGQQGWAGHAELVVEGKDMAAVSQLAGRIQTMTIARTAFALSREARERIEGEVTAQAIAQFKQRAELAARQFGFGGWSLREVQLQGGEMPMSSPIGLRAQAMGAVTAGEALPVEAGKAQVTVTVTGSVQLSPR